jgi:hypothetical protein
MLVLKSDHPVTDAKGLMYAAARAVHYGLSVEDALRSMTINAAITLGLDHRIGKIESGYDADIVIWDRHPLSLGAAPRAVYIEGALKHTGAPPAVLPPPFGPPELAANHAAFTLSGPCDATTEGGLIDLATYSVSADLIYTMDGGYQSTIRQGVVVVQNGIISCVGTSSSCATDLSGIPQSGRFTTNGQMWAGMVAAGDGIGMYEMGEAPTHDGTARGTDDEMLDLWAVDGMRTGGRHQWEAFRGALTVSVTPPEGRGRLVTGVSGAWWVTPKSVGWDQAVLKKAVALHMTLGNAAKGAGGLAGSVSGQLLMIRKILTREVVHTGHTGTLEAVRNGSWPLVMHVHQADAIDALLRTSMAVLRN